MTPTRLQRKFLRGLAAINASAPRGEEAWWSVRELRMTLPGDFGALSVGSLTGLGNSCQRKGMARSRRAGQHQHATNYYAQYRITGLGWGLVADSCIGSGLPWSLRGVMPTCPACLMTRPDLAVPLLHGTAPDTIPPHPLPGYDAPASRARGDTGMTITHAPATATEETR